MKLKTLARSSLVDEVVEQIRGIIERGSMAAGARLPSESVLAAQLGVSRTVLREAVGRLETIGVVRVERGRGMFVGDRSALNGCVQMVRSALAISPRELLTFLEFRWAIEVHAARRAAEKATPEQVAELEALAVGIDHGDHDDMEAMRRDLAFHLRLVELTGNELMRTVMEIIQQFALAGMVQTTPSPRDREESHARHLSIVRAIATRDPRLAEQAMHEHMERTRERLQARLAESAGQMQGLRDQAAGFSAKPREDGADAAGTSGC